MTTMNLDRGAFHFSLPYTIWGWVAWVIGLLIAIACFLFNPMISAFGFGIMAFASPGSLESDLRKMRQGAQPAEVLEARHKKVVMKLQAGGLDKVH